MERSTRELLLASATRCFTRLGYKKASVDSIAEGAGVAKGTVYLYCESKQDLFYQAVHRELRDWVGELSRHIDPRRPATELMREIAVADAQFVEQRPLVRDLLFGVFHGQLPEWAERFEALRAVGRKHVIEILTLGIRQGLFAPELDVEATARVLQDLQLSGVLLQRRTGQDEPSVRSYQLAAFTLVMKGLERR